MKLETFLSLSEQTLIFLLSVPAGACLAVIYDIFRVWRIIFPAASHRAAAFISDVLFMLICGFCVFLFAVRFSGGVVRFFCVIGSAAGFILYFFTVGNTVVSCLRRVMNAFRKCLRKVYMTIIAPIVKIPKVIYPKVFNKFVHSYENEEKSK
jgi:spore cortex biosynthesis protein YabQ